MSNAGAFASVDVAERIRVALGRRGAGSLLDAACGPGFLVAALADSFASVVGLDATQPMLERARERCAHLGNVRFEQGDALDLPFEEGVFDAVVNRLTLHHMERPLDLARELHRVVRPGGRIVVADVITSDDPEDAALHNALETLRDPSHVRMLTGAELREVVETSGLIVEAEQDWTQKRRFPEWAAIVDDERRSGPVDVVMRRLAETGQRAGIGLRLEEGTVVFDHHWLLVSADRPRG